MLVRIFSLTFNSILGKFDDAELREFFKDKELISIRDHFFIRNEIPYLTLIIQYFSFRPEADAQSGRSPHPSVHSSVHTPFSPAIQPAKRDEVWKKLLTEADLGLFNLIRDWRSKRCKEEGVPPYVLFTNLQLAFIVKNRPQSLAELARIDGIGTAKIEKYGADLLSFTRQVGSTESPKGKDES